MLRRWRILVRHDGKVRRAFLWAAKVRKKDVRIVKSKNFVSLQSQKDP